MRLIDADALLDELRNTETSLARKGVYLVKGECNLYKIIKDQPTAYDVDKVVEELDECSANHFGKHNHYDEGMMDAYDFAIDIVRRG